MACVHVCKEPTELLTLTDTGRPIPLWATTFPKNRSSDCIRADSALNMSLFLTALDYECELTVASDSFCLDISQKQTITWKINFFSSKLIVSILSDRQLLNFGSRLQTRSAFINNLLYLLKGKNTVCHLAGFTKVNEMQHQTPSFV